MTVNLTAGQAVVVDAFIKCVRDRKLPQRAAVILVETGIVESGLRILANPSVPSSQNIPHEGEGADHLSVGPLQQQVPMWGTAADCMNPYTSAGKFLDHLTSFNWQALPTGQAAQAVQVSAFPDRYQAQEALATAIVQQRWPVSMSKEDDVTELHFNAGDGERSAFFLNGGKALASLVNADRIDHLAQGKPHFTWSTTAEFTRALQRWSN